MNGPITSPDTYGALLGAVQVCYFEIAFNQPSPYPVTLVTAWNSPTSPYTKIEIRDNAGVTQTFPLPTSGTKETAAGPYNGWFKATVTQATINSRGFTNRSDLQSYTVS